MAFQFKIQLKGISEPEIWRRVLVPDTCTFNDLHGVIHLVFEWSDGYPYQFFPSGKGSTPVITLPRYADGKPVDDATAIKLSKYFKHVGDSFVYTQDTGDNWLHKITLEAKTDNILEYPVCTAWSGMRPPEKCGGYFGFERIKEVMKNPDSPEAVKIRTHYGLIRKGCWEESTYFSLQEVNSELKIGFSPMGLLGRILGVTTPYSLSKERITPPALYHPEVSAFYEFGIDIDQQLVAEILQLPRQTLIADMRTILQDSMDRRKEYETIQCDDKYLSAPIHALVALSLLKAEEELDLLLTVLRQPEDYFALWFGLLEDELLWHVVYALGENQPDKLWNAMLEPFGSHYAITAIPQAFSQMALHERYPKETVLEWFEELIPELVEQHHGAAFADTTFYSFTLLEYSYLVDMNCQEFISKCYELTTGYPEQNELLEDVSEFSEASLGPDKRERLTTVAGFYNYMIEFNRIDFPALNNEVENLLL